MNITENVIDKLCIKQWSIGLAYANVEQILNNGISEVDFHWLPIQRSERFFADPFIFHDPQNRLVVTYEDFDLKDQYGKISYSLLDQQFRIQESGLLLDMDSHLSYPNTYKYRGKRYIIPEASKSGKLIAYEFDASSKKLGNPITIIEHEALLDATILKHNGRFWLFATKRGEESNKTLYIYHSHRWDGDYIPHKNNPVKTDLSGSRPAGHFFCHNGEIYRPTQNSTDYYGKSIQINRIICLNEEEFREEPIRLLEAPKHSKYNFAMHTMNFSNGVLVIDGLRRIFNPLKQIQTKLKQVRYN